jgi:outer membrane protein OmpA-like peptidoglycan-associated protein
MFFDSNKSFLLPKGLAGIRGITSLYAENPGAQLLVVGHTDTTADPSYNNPLSLERAEAVTAYLTDDVEAWLAWYGYGKSDKKRWGAKEDNDMLSSLPDHATKPPNESSVRWFQRTRGLGVDGVAGDETRRALITEYMAHDGTSLPGDVQLTNHGCGESFPEFEETFGDEEAKAGNRRVELYFFDGSMGIQPPPPSTISKPGSLEYPEWVRRAQETHDFELIRRERDCHFSFVLVDKLSEEPLQNEAFVLDIGEGETLQGETNDDGQLEFGDVPAGDYLLEIQDKKMFVPAISKDETRRLLLVRDDKLSV